VDAHQLGDGHWGLGLVLRWEDGRCVGAATREVWGLSEVIEAEAMGLSEAVVYLSKVQHDRVIIEMDNQSIVKAVINRNFPRKYWGQIARCGEDYLAQNPNCSIRWTIRGGNEAAHYLARHALFEPNSDWVDSVPPLYCCSCPQRHGSFVIFSFFIRLVLSQKIK
jgi:ribonuclease HI